MGIAVLHGTILDSPQAQRVSPPKPILAPMDAADNFLADFPPEDFTLLAFCDACGRQVLAHCGRVRPSVTIQGHRQRLRGSACGSHQIQLRVVYTTSGGFRYGDADDR